LVANRWISREISLRSLQIELIQMASEVPSKQVNCYPVKQHRKHYSPPKHDKRAQVLLLFALSKNGLEQAILILSMIGTDRCCVMAILD
jgi:hypothetical protein